MGEAAASGKAARIPAASTWGEGTPGRDDLGRDWVSRDSEERWETELREMDRGMNTEERRESLGGTGRASAILGPSC